MLLYDFAQGQLVAGVKKCVHFIDDESAEVTQKHLFAISSVPEALQSRHECINTTGELVCLDAVALTGIHAEKLQRDLVMEGLEGVLENLHCQLSIRHQHKSSRPIWKGEDLISFQL